MQAQVGDELTVKGRHQGDEERHGTILRVDGKNGAPPYLVRPGCAVCRPARTTSSQRQRAPATAAGTSRKRTGAGSGRGWRSKGVTGSAAPWPCSPAPMRGCSRRSRSPAGCRTGQCWALGRMSGLSWPPYSDAPPTGSRWWTGDTPGCSTSSTMRPRPSRLRRPRPCPAPGSAAGTGWRFAADARTLTAARVRELAAPLVVRWAEERAEHVAGQATQPGTLAATGLGACLAAVNACAAQTLIVPEDGLVPGYECGRCGALSVDADQCPDWGTAALRVPDVIDEMVARTLEDGGEVYPVHDGMSRIAARLRFPVAQ